MSVATAIRFAKAEANSNGAAYSGGDVALHHRFQEKQFPHRVPKGRRILAGGETTGKSTSGEGNSLWNQALAWEQLGERAQALACAEAALPIYEAIESPNAERVRNQLAEWRQ
jgi:hypothetical protein